MTGKITKINGSVIEVGFADKGLPKINAALRLDADGHARYAEIAAHTGERTALAVMRRKVRGFAWGRVRQCSKTA